MGDDAKKTFTLLGAYGPIEVAKGEYYFNTKARARRMMGNSLSSDARRVYASLELGTMGFQQELAVTMVRGEQSPLTPAHIAHQTGLSRQNVRRGLEELEDAGLALRQAPDGGALRKGQVLIYSWAVPRPPQKEDCSRARLQLPEWFPESWEPLKPLISRFKYSLIDDEEAARDYIDEIAAAARAYKEAEIVAVRALERVCARPQRARASLLVERTERTTTKERTEPSSSSAVQVLSPPPKAEEEEVQSAYQTFKEKYPAGHFDEGKTKPSFERKTKTQQARILARLEVYLSCERWQDEGGRWIPLASNWLETCETDPPPALNRRQTGRGQALAPMDEVLELIRKNREADI